MRKASDLNEKRLKEIIELASGAKEGLVVKVCDTSDVGVHQSAQNEAQILQKLSCNTIVEFVAFYEDPLINKSYLVTKHAGSRNIEQFVRE